jgi:predicted peroxiredoxin
MARTTHLVIKLATGVQDAERVAQAFSVASTAVAAGIEVSLWLAGEASWLATLVSDATVTLCTQCAVRRNINDGDQIPGIRIAGSATFVEEITNESTQALVY